MLLYIAKSAGGSAHETHNLRFFFQKSGLDSGSRRIMPVLKLIQAVDSFDAAHEGSRRIQIGEGQPSGAA